MASQRPYGNPPSSYPPPYQAPLQSSSAPPSGNINTGMQNLNLGRPLYPPPADVPPGTRPYNVPTNPLPSSSASPFPSGPPPGMRPPYPTGPPSRPPFSAAPSSGVAPPSLAAAPGSGVPQYGPSMANMPPFGAPPSSGVAAPSSAITNTRISPPVMANGPPGQAPSVVPRTNLPFSSASPLSTQGNLPGRVGPAGPPFASTPPLSSQASLPGRVASTVQTTANQVPQGGASNGLVYQQMPSMSPVVPMSAPGQPQGVVGAAGAMQQGTAMYPQRPTAQFPWRPPQSQPIPYTGEGGYGSAGVSTTAAQPPTWSMTSTPPFPGVTPKPQGVNAMPNQNLPPLPPQQMAQYLGQGVSQPGSPAAPSSASRIDPSQIPRPQVSSMLTEFETRVTGQAPLPPSTTSNFVVRDTGNCSPRYMRCTLNQIPCSGDLLATSGMPLALMVQPLALPHPSEDPIQIVDFGESGPVRCSRCKAYINPFMKFVDQGRHFKCNFCGHANDTPRDYYCNLGPDNRRRDADERPELCKGTVEFVATKEYMVRPPMSALFFFLIDVSMNAITTGAAVAACNAVQRVLGDIPDSPHTKIGIATFDNTVHFYNFHQALQQPSMLVMPDVQDVYTPLKTGLAVSVTEYRQQLGQLLENIPIMFQGTSIPDSAVGAAIKAAFLAVKPYGGKLLVFQSGLPSIGFAALNARDSDARKVPVAGEKDANKLLQPADKTLKTLALELAESQVSCDLFLTAQEYVDIASLGVVPMTTGGQIYYYYPFSATSDSAKLYNDLRWNLTRPQGLEAVMRVRCTQGLQVQEYSGSFCKLTPTDVDLPAVDCDKAIMVTFKHDDKFQDNSECCFQCALLYTTMDGQRRIRITTLSLTCTTVLSNVFRGADLDTQFTYFMKQAAQEVQTTSVAQVREQVTSSCVNILHTYRKFCATASSSGQLILPEALKLLPLYTLALMKSFGLRSDMRTDDRSYWLGRVASMSTSLAIPTVYPRMFAIHDIESKEVGDGMFPPTLHLSSENLDNDGIFLLETGEDAYIYAGKSVSPDLLAQLFGVHSVNEMPPNQFILQEFDNVASRKLNALVNEIRKQRCSYLRFRWCRRGDPLEFVFFSLMVEDKNALGLSYVEYLVHVHRQIQNKMT